MQGSVNGRHTAFSIWLRTGRLPGPGAAETIERKYNPWHDPADGRFTFVGAGRHYGSAGERRGARLASPARPPLAVDVPYGPSKFEGGAGSYGGAGATGSWDKTVPQKPQRTRQPVGPAAMPLARPKGRASTRATPAVKPLRSRRVHRSIVQNGYQFDLDALDRTMEVTGSVTENPQQLRSRRLQAQAGGRDRRPTDEGGHYIARQFNGPVEFFNHFAQDRTFNRSEYRRIELQWLREIRKGHRMPVRIVPRYRGLSRRPYQLDIYFEVDGIKQSFKISNGSKGMKSAEK